MVIKIIRDKMGQMKIQQMAFMLIAVMLFFGMVGLVVLGVVFSGLDDKATELKEKNARLLVSKLANSPEFSCGGAFGNTRTNCIDRDKVIALKDKIGIYESFWDVKSIQIRIIYPELEGDGGDILCEQNNYYSGDCNLIRVLEGEDNLGISIGNYVSLCKKEKDLSGVYDKCELAQIYASYEVVQ